MVSKLRLVLALALALAPLSVGAAQARPVDRAERLLRQAEQSYFRMRMEDAERRVIEAVEICEREGCPAATRATLYVALGSIAYTASGDGLRARMAFDRALNLDPHVAPDQELSNPEVRAIFDEVRASHRATPRPDAPPEEAAESDPDADVDADVDADTDIAPMSTRRRRTIFFMELGYSLTSASVGRGMETAVRPETGYFGEDFQLDARVDNDSYLLSGTHGCEAPTFEYCVRVTEGAFAFTHGFHATLGAYITRHFGVAARVRLAPSAGGGSLIGARGTGGGPFSHVAGGLRFYVRPIAPLPTGFHFAIFAGPMAGQIQVRPRQETTVQGAAIAEPWVRTGLYGAELGFPLGYRLTPGFGFFVSPEAYVLAPRLSFGLQVTTGLDVSFGWASN
jgi:hypothetical protein